MLDFTNEAVNDFVINYAHYIGYLPLGVIGVWRWSVWTGKKIISLFYKEPHGSFRASVSVITPVYNEDPAMFSDALESWKRNRPKEIIAVIDYTDQKCIDVFEAFSRNFPGAKMIVTKKPGKRAALADGIKISKGRIIALVDSDTVWTEGFLPKVTGPFGDKKVGGVAPRQDVMNADTIAKRLFRIHIFNRYGNDLIYQAAFGNAISCISGRTGIYRRKAIVHLTDELENEYFLGKKCISGDDKRLTNLIQRDGWKVKYVRSALVYTPGFPDLSTYLKQQIRWTRNSWRSDVTSITQKWMWRNPFLTFHTIDRFVQPFTLLLGPIFAVIALYKGDLIFVWFLLAWWFFSRSIKIGPHLLAHPRDFLIMPAYIVYTYIIAVIKIFTLITVGEQSWITRWDKNRLNKVHAFKKWSAYGMTATIILALFSASFYINVYMVGARSFWQKQQMEIAQKEKKMTKMEEQSLVSSLSEEQARNREMEILKEINSDDFGYYQAGYYESVLDIKRRFLLPQDAIVYSGSGDPFPQQSTIQYGDIVKIPIAYLQNPSLETYQPVASQTVFVEIDQEENAIRISGKGSIITIPQLAQRLRYYTGTLQNLGEKTWILRRNLFIDDGVTLVITGDDVAWLKLKSEENSFAWIKAENGNIVIRDTKITSWSEIAQDHDTNIDDGRSYVLQKSNGRMDITNSEMAYLGYYGAPRRGNPYGGPYGTSWKIESGFFGKQLSTGMIKDSHVHHNLFGMYSYGATGIVISNSKFFENIAYGIDPHDDTNHMLVENNEVYLNGSHGIIASKRCFANVIRGNYSHDNVLHGIMLDRDSNYNLIEKNYTSGNVNGIALYQSGYNVIRNNHIINNRIGIRGNKSSGNNYIGYNTIELNDKGLYFYQESVENHVWNNSFLLNKINVHLKGQSKMYIQ